MQMSKFNITGELRVTYISGATEMWDKKINLFSNTSKSALLGDFASLMFKQLISGEVYGDNIQDDVVFTDLKIGEGDGSTTPTISDVSPLPIKPNSVSVTVDISSTPTTVTDDGSGNLTGLGSETGTINYATGAISITWDAATDSGDPILMDATRGIETDDALTTGFYFDLATDAVPTLTDEDFTTKLGLTSTKLTTDLYTTDTKKLYEVELSASYTGADTAVITGLGIYFDGISGTAAGTVTDTSVLMKSTTMKENSIYTDGDLILKNACTITCTFRIESAK